MGWQERLVLIVDDSPEDRAAMRRFLRQDPRASYRFLEESTGAEGMAIARSAALDCLLIDFSLPDMDGLEFIRRLTAETGGAPFPIVMLTGKGSETVAVQALKCGAEDYVVKGQFDAASIAATVGDAIEKFALRPGREREKVEKERDHQQAQEAMRLKERLVLLLDDSPEDREAARRFLSRDPQRSYRFLEAGTGEEGLGICQAAGLDCVLLDYSLPDMDGLEFLQELTTGTAVTPFPVVMMTGRGDESIAVQALKAGAQDYLIKGRFDDETLRRTVDNAIASVVDRRAVERQRIRLLERLEREARMRADELAEMDRRKNEFLAMLAHELRNPLAPIRSALHLMSLPGVDGETVERARAMAQRQVAQLARLVDDLLEVSRITRGKIQLCIEDVDLAGVMTRVAEAVRPIMEQHDHALEVAPPAEPIVLAADAARLEQILVNLLNNAAKYTEHGGRIWLTAEREGERAAIRVRDNGIGIAREMLPLVFDMFAQVDRSLDRAQGGLGIGLTLVRTLAELHGGSVDVESAGLGQGSEFTVRLPIAKAGERPARLLPRTEPLGDGVAGASGRPLRILVVEDHTEGAEILATLLDHWGHHVEVVSDGVKALDAVAADAPELILMDLGLPGMDGFEVARRVRERHGERSPFLIALTGYGQEEARRRSSEVGFDLHLVKPVDPKELSRLLTEVEFAGDGTAHRGDGRPEGL
ncbi:hybrid sensor histidine kinase/response regulator [Paludisphaera mucosa]|uniref:histidine kinase n=1 Tax=Paludisphaera mucosa TaxID=3030827 RepID=A0ABT6FHJ8_9BACT|nr:response regulator [Paludisphaera mucosa]MDG3007035.1 response regulator [Paludisphaera mucosa]